MSGKNPFYDPSKTHHTPDGFTNAEPHDRQEGDLKRWRKERKELRLPAPPAKGYEHFVSQWWQVADFSGSDDRLWFLGHACLLLRVAGRYILMDPALSHRASPFSFYGPERKTPVAVTVEELPPIDVVLLSHNHYDHLDSATVRKLLRRFPEVQFMVPLGIKRWLERRGARYIEELDWWDEQQFGELKFSAVPARHWSMRTLWDRNRSLWCGWVVSHPGLQFFFSGDSGYSNQFEIIGQRLGPFDLAAIPVGAYAPRWFMRAQHMDPQQAVAVFTELCCKKAVPIHWGVFELADESLDQPLIELAEAISQSESPEMEFKPLKIGASISKD
ncbi:MBL fold metallo-hydrolase [Rahnella aceris]|uniref:MBL fold metallo-hydrolase n=1 Tax=Rahnella sp. (strain Y9602) TaxID=2703885 RepID=UPI001C25D1AD|nr:MBL fold metallo-hydrolase [Rahnella aceris]MBU9848776.1 MBL fold metallo-hydrolase [Rahnella aceris]